MFDINEIPFSYFVVSHYPGEGLFIRDIRNGDMDTGKIFKLTPCDEDGKAIIYHCLMKAHLLQILSQQNEVLLEFCFADENTLLLATMAPCALCKFELLLQKYDHINPLNKNMYELHSYSQQVKMLLCVRQGEIKAILPWERIGNSSATLFLKHTDGRAELTMESYLTVAKQKEYPSFAVCVVQAKNFYQDFQKKLPILSDNFKDTWNQACYILFSCIVHPEGMLKKYAIYMSNNYMTNIWSWDNAFTSLGMLLAQPKMAYEQFTYFHELQDESGIFPDFVNNKYTSFACCKPPIHGFIYQILMRENSYFTDTNRLIEVYQMLKHLASYWENYRKSGNLYFYNHGNDSGWDNATMFAQGCPLIGPDLAAHLITLHDALADIAAKLPKNLKDCDGVGMHRNRAKEIARNLVAELWNGCYFVAKKINGDFVDIKYCLLRLLPLVAAKYLPTEIIDTMVGDLCDPRQFTDFGFATERLDSPLYESNGYWRGPIWAPSTLLLVEALQRCGNAQLAKSAAEKFCQLCEVGGLAENFDAVTGKGLGDSAFAWTSSVFLHLGAKL